MKQRPYHWFASIVFTAIMVGLIAFAVTQAIDFFFFVLISAIVGSVGATLLMFPGSRLFAMALANMLAIYTCFYIFFLQTVFRSSEPIIVSAAYILPILGFIIGAWLKQKSIRRVVFSEKIEGPGKAPRPFLWLIPVFAIGFLSFFLPGRGLEQTSIDAVLLVAMAGIAGIVFAVSKDVAAFLIEVGLLFEEFFGRISQLFVPAVAFLSFYSILVIVFACIYRIIDRFTVVKHFAVEGMGREITFLDSFYFSVVTMSTLGYGDIVPITDLVRAIVSVQIVFGVLLLLFGFNEILSYGREGGGRRGRK
ncbi:MAG: potassium channel family protein [Alphaproteobacteria bacterium]